MKNPKVAIVVATYNQEELLVDCLKSLEKTKYSNYKIFFVDDTGKNIGGRIKKRFNVELITTKGSSGQSRVWNEGIKRALGWNFDYVLLIDDDTEFVNKNWLSELVKVGESDKRIGLIGCKLIYADGSMQHVGGYIRGWRITRESNYPNKVFEVDHVMGCFMLIKREVIDKIGLVDEIYTPYLLEETDYCIKIKKNRFKIVTVPYVEVIHKKSKTINTQTNSKKMFVRFKNDIIFSRRHLKPKDRLFRLFVYLPLVAIFRKRKDEDSLELKSFRLRKEFLINLKLLAKAFYYVNSRELK
ncbi:MAG: glycosyltransferase family 2 protein [Candidatus Pacearchaeota archaeon]|nr:glycosyltransferase family 2 protein [Candidatus Pacearchaeota archaeon]